MRIAQRYSFCDKNDLTLQKIQLIKKQNMRISILIILSFFFTSAFSQLNQEIEDVKHNQIILIGEIDKTGFLLDNYKSWYTESYSNYQLDSNVIHQLKTIINPDELEIKIFLASWCSDSREQVPRFIKIIDSLNIEISINFYALDANKSCPNINSSEFGIERIPTFIFYKLGQEIGRIIETPKQTLEHDFLEIILNKS